jgi:Protein of unknown function (DUF1648)
MNRNLFKALIVLLWAAPVAVAVRYWQVWDRLSARMATHFDAAGRANGWMTREESFHFSVGFVAVLVLVFSAILWLVERKYPLAKLSWALLGFFHLETWMTVYMMNSMVAYSLNGSPVEAVPLLVATPLGILMVLVVAFVEKRGSGLPPSDLIAEEVHSGKSWSVIFLVPLLGLVPALVAVKNTGARLALGVVGIILVSAFAMAWTGFHYRFTRQGIEIRTLGYRLRTIPLLQIQHYEPSRWSALGGYGIRGIGNRKAYVWGNQGVRMKLYDGEVFLGHNDPQRIIHDLDVIEQYRNAR